jgi:phytoene dehydrogenase-like protein
VVENDRVLGVQCQQQLFPSDLVVSDADIHLVYRHLLPQKYYPKKLLSQEKSSSAFVFYWGINRTFDHLGLHNIFFSENYREEFQHIFNGDSPGSDPTVYINITSKYCKEDAPEGGENWFVMINVPHHKAKTIEYAPALRAAVVAKINRILKVDIEKHIVEEATLDPIGIEQQTSSFGGSLYGNSSNNRFSAFLRHANYSSKIKGLYFVGGSAHPGGGIPLCLLSAKIATNIILEREK